MLFGAFKNCSNLIDKIIKCFSKFIFLAKYLLKLIVFFVEKINLTLIMCFTNLKSIYTK